MAMTWIWAALVILSLVFGIATGRLDAVADAALTGAQSAVELSVSMAGVLCLWSGVMEVMRECGITAGVARVFQPLLRRLFPRASQDPETLAALSANVSANLLGLGNAATPLGIQAARRMAAGCNGTASDELCLLVVLNTASIQLFPATIGSLRAAAGSAAPFDILPAVWITSIASVSAGLIAAKLFSRLPVYSRSSPFSGTPSSARSSSPFTSGNSSPLHSAHVHSAQASFDNALPQKKQKKPGRSFRNLRKSS